MDSATSLIVGLYLLAAQAGAIYRTETMEQTLKDDPPTNEEQRAALIQSYAGKRAPTGCYAR